MPCHGRSPVRRVDSLAGLVEENLGAFDALGVDGEHLVGHSLGGAVALAVADRRPKAVRPLALLCPAGLGPEINGAAVRGIAAASKPESLAPWLKLLAADPDRIDGSYLRAATAARGNPALRAAQAEFAETLFPDGVQRFDLTGVLARDGCPACIIWGKQDSMIPWEHARRRRAACRSTSSKERVISSTGRRRTTFGRRRTTLPNCCAARRSPRVTR